MEDQKTFRGSCLERAKLQESLRVAAQVYLAAAAEFANCISTLPEAEYISLGQRVDRSRAASQKAREELDSHEREHGC